MLALQLTIHGDEELRERLVRSVRELPNLLVRLGWASGYTIEREYKQRVSEGPLFARSASAGAEGSISAFSELTPGGLRAGAGGSKFYLIVHEEGRTIVPVNKTFLHFFTREGEEVFTKGPVVIPARKPGELAAKAAEPKVRQIWSNGLNGLAIMGA